MKCSFCGKPIPKGTGKIVASKTGSLLFFCSHKCERNMRMGRKPQKLKWTEKHKELKIVKKTERKEKKRKEKKKKLSKKERRELRKKKKLEKKKKALAKKGKKT